MKFGSLFAGIGGLDLGLERAGMECAWQVEIDDYCQRVLAKHWPEVPKYRDVRECGAHNLEAVDLICGGFPCQPHSLAGKRKGKGDDRNLWPEYRRIVAELRPRWVLGENVPGIITTMLDEVLSDLESEGYAVTAITIPAVALDAPHRRDRVFVVAHSEGSDARQSSQQSNHQRTGPNRESQRRGFRPEPSRRGDATHYRNTGYCRICGSPIINDRTTCEHDAIVADASGERAPRTARRCGELQSSNATVLSPNGARLRDHVGHGGEDVADAEGTGDMGGSSWSECAGRAGIDGASWWATEPNVGRVADGVPAQVDRLRALGNAVVPQVAEWIGRRIVQLEEAQ